MKSLLTALKAHAIATLALCLLPVAFVIIAKPASMITSPESDAYLNSMFIMGNLVLIAVLAMFTFPIGLGVHALLCKWNKNTFAAYATIAALITLALTVPIFYLVDGFERHIVYTDEHHNTAEHTRSSLEIALEFLRFYAMCMVPALAYAASYTYFANPKRN